MSNESFILSLTSQRNEKVVFITSILAYCKKKKKKKLMKLKDQQEI